MSEKVTKASVNYRMARGERRCGNCSMFTLVRERLGNCSLVEGRIDKRDVCDRWERKHAE